MKTETAGALARLGWGLALVGALASGCAAAKSVLRGVNDAAKILCLGAAQKAGEKQLAGMSAEEWCEVHDNLQPFIDEALAAQQAAASQAGLSAPETPADADAAPPSGS